MILHHRRLKTFSSDMEDKITTMIADRNKCLSMVCALMGVAPVAVMGRKRDQRTSMARHIVMWALRLHQYSLPQIGFLMARNHGGVYYAIRKVEDNIALNVAYNDELKQVTNIIKQQIS